MSYPGKGDADFLQLGSWNATCWECGRKKKAETLWKYWQGYWLCPAHWNPRQPQDYAKGVKETITPPWVQPMPAYVYSGPSLTQQSGTPGTPLVAEFSSSCAAPVYLTLDTGPGGLVGPYPVKADVAVGATVTLIYFNYAWIVPSVVVITPSSGIKASNLSASYTVTVTTGCAGDTVAISSLPSGVVITPALATSDGTKTATLVITSARAGTFILQPTITTLNYNTPSTIQAIFGINATVSTVVLTSSSINQFASTTCTVTLKDGLGNPLSGHTVSLATSAGVVITPPSGVSSALGVVAFSLLGNAIGSYTITATDSTQAIALTTTPSLGVVAIPFSFASRLVNLPSTANWVSAAYSPVSQNWCIIANGSNKAAYSTDGGETWIATTLPSSANWNAVAADFTGGFVAVVEAGTAVATGGTPTWASGTALVANNFGVVTNNGTTLMTIGQDNKSYVTTSPGSGWTTAGTLSVTGGTITGLAGVNTASTTTTVVQTNVAGNNNTDNLGTSWASTNLGWTNGAPRIAAAGTGATGVSPRFLAVRASGGGAVTNGYSKSDDAATWTTQTFPTGKPWLPPVWCANSWVIANTSDNVCLTSSTGLTSSWTSQTLAATPAGCKFPADVNGQRARTVIPQGSGTNQIILITTDGT